MKEAPSRRVDKSMLAYTSEHEIFRRMARRFLKEECAPHLAEWDEAGIAPREIWRRAGELGLLCASLSPRPMEEQARIFCFPSRSSKSRYARA
jgi:hypothetical protein